MFVISGRFPIEFRLTYTDGLGVQRLRAFELRQDHELHAVGQIQTANSTALGGTGAYWGACIEA